ncbi:MAG: hypothetical protein RR982_05415 [Kiritimatiellia bacterium]
MKVLLFFVLSLFFFGCKTANSNNPPMLCGGYTEFRTLETDDVARFSQVTLGTRYEAWKPLQVASQVVAGMNYRFLCKDTEGKTVTLIIFQPLPGRGEAQITSHNE